jgi:hypothetical protein
MVPQSREVTTGLVAKAVKGRSIANGSHQRDNGGREADECRCDVHHAAAFDFDTDPFTS